MKQEAPHAFNMGVVNGDTFCRRNVHLCVFSLVRAGRFQEGLLFVVNSKYEKIYILCRFSPKDKSENPVNRFIIYFKQ